MKKLLWVLALSALVGLAGCAGDDGDQGPVGPAGPSGPAGPAGQDAPRTGTVQGKVVDGSGNGVADATVETVPPTVSVTTGADGLFTLADIPVGGYTCTASKANLGSVNMLVGVTGGGTTSATLALQTQASADPARISGKVLDVKGAGIGGANVAVEGQGATVNTSADGSFELTGVEPGSVYLYVTSPSEAYLDGETLKSIPAASGATVSGVEITLSGRPSASATTVGMAVCKGCHGGTWPDIFAAFDSTSNAAAHSRFVTEGTSHLVYKDKWPQPGDKLLPRDPKGKLLMVQDPLDGSGLVNVVLCTQDGAAGREYLFKFYPEQAGGVSRAEGELDCSAAPAEAVWIPVAATIGGEGNWGEGYVDPGHTTTDRHPNFGEGKQRYMCKIPDVPFLKKWMTDNNVPLTRAKQDYVCFMPVYMVQDGTPVGSDVLVPSDFGTPKFWQKSPTAWCNPDNTLSRNCAGCHTTGTKIDYQDIGSYKAVVTSFDYKDLNTTCEKCHGSGSEHASSADKAKIIIPKFLTQKAANELCGVCHASHDGKSANPKGIFKAPFDAAYKSTLGNGFFVPGVYDLAEFYWNYNMPAVSNPTAGNGEEGPFHSWPDQTHGRAHSMELPELLRSRHYNNSYEKLTCYTCHDAHTLDAGPASLASGDFYFANAAYGNNALCLVCHATQGSFADVSKADVAVLQGEAGRTVTKNGTVVTVADADAALARNRVAKAVGKHMQAGAGMGGALYTPDDPNMPVGNCASCHMPKIGKLQDLNDDAQYHLAPDVNGKSAVAEGNVPSHVFDIVWPAQSAILKNPDPAKGHDYDIMPNSCSKCHDFARISGDND